MENLPLCFWSSLLSVLCSLSLGSGFPLCRAKRHSKPLEVKIGLVVLGRSGRSLFHQKGRAVLAKGDVPIYVFKNLIVLWNTCNCLFLSLRNHSHYQVYNFGSLWNQSFYYSSQHNENNAKFLGEKQWKSFDFTSPLKNR